MRAELGPRTVGRIAACLFAAAGVLSSLTLLLPHPPGMNDRAVFLVSVAAVLLGGLTYIAPWDTWPRSASLALVPIAFAMIAVGNAYGSTRPYTYSVYYIVTFAWVGMSQPRWTSIWFAPFAAAAYVAPMYVRPGAERTDAVGAAVVVPVCVLVAELIAWIVAAERRNRISAHALVRSASALGQHLDEARLSQTLVDEARHALGSEHAVLFQIDPVSVSITDVHGSAVPERVHRVLDRLPGTKLPALPSEIVGGDPMVVTHSQKGGLMIDDLLRYGVKSYVAVPVMARGSLVGVLACWESSHHRTYSPQDLALAGAIAGQASAAIENARLYERTRDAARRDHLTGLGNRRAFRERLEAEVERARRYGRDLSLILVDCDSFKRVNDTLGHLAGDRVLERIGEMLLRNRRVEDGAYRIGGDEFALLLPETASDGAATLAERLRRTLERAALGTNRELPLTASLGIASYGTNAANVDDLFVRADAALYEAKASGGNATALPPGDGAARGEHLGVDVRAVIDNELLYALHQPIFELPTGDVLGFETFVRLDPVCGHTPTATLFRAAAGAGMSDALDRACRRTALASAHRVASDAMIFLNVTAAVLAADWPITEDICLQIDRQGLARERIVVEITQHERSSSSRTLVRNLRACQHEGMKIAMDDFTGALPDLDLLGAISFDYVKVDMSFIRPTADIASRRAVLRALCVVIRETGARPIAEGVESVEDLHLVRDLGFAAAQGFVLRAPASIPDLSPRPLQHLLTPRPLAAI